MRDPLLHRLELANSPDEQVTPAADQADRAGQLPDRELSPAEARTAFEQAFAGLSQRITNESIVRQAEADGAITVAERHGS